MDALMWRCAGWAGRVIIHHPPLAGGPPSSAEEGEEGAWGVGAAGRAGGEGMDVLNLQGYRKDDGFVCDKMAKY